MINMAAILVCVLPVLLILNSFLKGQRRQKEQEARALYDGMVNHRMSMAINLALSSEPGLSTGKRLDGIDHRATLAVSRDNRELCLFTCAPDGCVSLGRYHAGQIIRAQVVDSGATIYDTHINLADQFKRAAVGDLIGGRTGAAIGAVTARRVTTASQVSTGVELHVFMEDPDQPLWKIVLSNQSFHVGSPGHRIVADTAAQWAASLEAMARQGQQSASNRTPTTRIVPPPLPPMLR